MITNEEVSHLARLSRLRLPEKEAEKLQKDLGEILQYVEMLQEADVQDVMPISHITGLVNTPRADNVIEPFGAPSDLLKAAPFSRGDWIKVPRILERA